MAGSSSFISNFASSTPGFALSTHFVPQASRFGNDASLRCGIRRDRQELLEPVQVGYVDRKPCEHAAHHNPEKRQGHHAALFVTAEIGGAARNLY
jgi:hypothetical protein